MSSGHIQLCKNLKGIQRIRKIKRKQERGENYVELT